MTAMGARENRAGRSEVQRLFLFFCATPGDVVVVHGLSPPPRLRTSST